MIDGCLLKFRPIGFSCRLVYMRSIQLYYFVDITRDFCGITYRVATLL